MPIFSQVQQSSDLQGLNLVSDLSEPLRSPTPKSSHVAEDVGSVPVPLSQCATPISGHGRHLTNSTGHNDSSHSREEEGDLPIRDLTDLTDLTARRAVINEKLDNLTSVLNQIPQLKAKIDNVEETLSHSLELSTALLSLIDLFEEQQTNNLELLDAVDVRLKGITHVVKNILARIAKRRDHGCSG